MEHSDTPINFDCLVNEILGIETLETRNSDVLDLYVVSVWNLKKVIEIVFEEGRKAASK